MSDRKNNLHLIAINNLSDTDRILERFWEHKFKIPIKAYGDHTQEELVVAFLEEYYYNNPEEKAKVILASTTAPEDEWTGEMDEEYEAMIQKRLKGNKAILSKYQSKEVLTPEKEAEILSSLGSI